ncbi:hypothetical protein ACP70R_032453 [Stipagrostis hirtigluma subsp. patula]
MNNADPWRYPGDAGEAAAAGNGNSFADMMADYSTGDLIEMVCL